MTIALIHPFKSFLPEITAYKAFFSAYKNIQVIEVHTKDGKHVTADVKWYIMGRDFDRKNGGALKIHEYVSLSLPPFASFKNWIKKTFSTKPDFRIFQNQFVKTELGFKDNVPYGFREMGIPEEMVAPKNVMPQKKHDFIYVGSVAGRNMETLLNRFTSDQFSNYSLLVLSHQYQALAAKYSAFKNIIFTGPVPHNQVIHYILAARFAINFFPTVFPHHRQTSTKFIEYAACKIPIITTEYEWIKDFQQKHGGNYFYVNANLNNFDIATILEYNYTFPDMCAWTWQRQIDGSGVIDFLKTRFPKSF